MHFAHPVGDTKKLSFTVIQMLVIPESAVTRTALVSIAKERERERERERECGRLDWHNSLCFIQAKENSHTNCGPSSHL